MADDFHRLSVAQTLSTANNHRVTLCQVAIHGNRHCHTGGVFKGVTGDVHITAQIELSA